MNTRNHDLTLRIRRTRRFRDRQIPHADRRQGSVLLVMLGLLLLLMVLGFTALTFTSQEHDSASSYADGAKPTGVIVDNSVLFDYGLEQLLLGPEESNKQSALWPGRAAMIPNMVGTFQANQNPRLARGPTVPNDRTPFNGIGVSMAASANGFPFVDNDHDRVPDADLTINGKKFSYLNLNLSPASGGPILTRDEIIQFLNTPDVDYSYPDLNNPFLAHIDEVQTDPSNPSAVVSVVIPSFHRPQYLRGSDGKPVTDWESNTAYAPRIMRPHPGHFVAGTNNPKIPRFMGPGLDGQPGIAGIDDDKNGIVDDDSELGANGSDDVFPFLARDANGNQIARKQGVWSQSGAITNLNDPSLKDYNNDVDNLGRGLRDAIWVDLGFPMFTLPDGRKVTPMFAITVLPADGLVNLNTAGNINGLRTEPNSPNQIVLSQQLISRSNFGRSPSEINPFWALMADPTNSRFLNPPMQSNNSASAKPLLEHAAFQKYQLGTPPVIGRIELANLESLFIQMGRPDLSITEGPGGAIQVTVKGTIEGRYGEPQSTIAGYNGWPSANVRWALLPRPGRPVSAGSVLGNYTSPADGDDDRNQFDGSAYDAQATPQPTYAYQHPIAAQQELSFGIRYPLGTGPNTTWSFGHPGDLAGSGQALKISPTNYGYTSNLTVDPNGGLSGTYWLKYTGYGAYSALSSVLNGNLTQNSNVLAMVENPSEMIIDRRYKKPGLDQILGPEEMFALHASARDFSSASTGSRARQLAPINFQVSDQAASIRKRFTTESWDRLQHSFHPDPFRAQSATVNWEFNGNLDGDDRLEFPPQLFGATPASQNSAPVFDSREPFRNAVRAMIGYELPSANSVEDQKRSRWATTAGYFKQMRIDINRLTTVAGRMNQAPFKELPIVARTSPNDSFLENPARSRKLTPHPINPGDKAIPTFPSSAPPTINSVVDQEFWARKDRQEMARDIYVLLYTLGAPAAVGNPLAVKPYQEWQLIEMAQFAVNLVDELDPDDVITKFEFDVDLTNGWDLDDNPYTYQNEKDRSLQGGTDAVVYGVEAQSLAFSEVLCVHQQAAPKSVDHSSTAYDDSASDRWFTHIELRNTSPYTIDLASGGWRLSVVDQTKGNGNNNKSTIAPVMANSQLFTSVIFKRNGRRNTTQIGAGELYTIGTMGRDDRDLDQFTDSGSTVVRSSDLRLDFDDKLDETFYRISPQIAENTPPKKTQDAPPGSDLDLIHSRDFGKNYFQLFDYTGNAQDVSNEPTYRGGFLRGPKLKTGQPIQMVLERRANGSRVAPKNYDPSFEEDNPWVVVDVFTLITPQELTIDKNDDKLSQAELRSHVSSLYSTERELALSRQKISSSVAKTTLPSSIGINNSLKLPASIDLWQPHFDRDFTSVLDLLSIPMYGPHETTNRLGLNGKIVMQLETSVGDIPSPAASLAAAKFLQPSHPADKAYDNRWHRILELLEVPSLTDESLVAQYPTLIRQSLTRTPGKLQLNAIPYGENLFALLDDPLTFGIKTNSSSGLPVIDDAFDPTHTQSGVSNGGGRNWWYEFLRSRDGIDPLTGLNLPGTAASRPFRSYAHIEERGTGAGAGAIVPETIEHTLLRRLGLDERLNGQNAGAATQFNDANKNFRRLFEARSRADLSANEVDPYARHRLLRKAANNSTTRGNVFMVWMTVGFFQSYQTDPKRPDWVTIGKEMEDQPRRRGFFIVDRSLLEDAYVPSSNPDWVGSYDFRKFIQYRRNLD